MVRGSYCQQMINFFFGGGGGGVQLTARLKLQFLSGIPLFKKSGSTPGHICATEVL